MSPYYYAKQYSQRRPYEYIETRDEGTQTTPNSYSKLAGDTLKTFPQVPPNLSTLIQMDDSPMSPWSAVRPISIPSNTQQPNQLLNSSFGSSADFSAPEISREKKRKLSAKRLDTRYKHFLRLFGNTDTEHVNNTTTQASIYEPIYSTSQYIGLNGVADEYIPDIDFSQILPDSAINDLRKSRKEIRKREIKKDRNFNNGEREIKQQDSESKALLHNIKKEPKLQKVDIPLNSNESTSLDTNLENYQEQEINHFNHRPTMQKINTNIANYPSGFDGLSNSTRNFSLPVPVPSARSIARKSSYMNVDPTISNQLPSNFSDLPFSQRRKLAGYMNGNSAVVSPLDSPLSSPLSSTARLSQGYSPNTRTSKWNDSKLQLNSPIYRLNGRSGRRSNSVLGSSYDISRRGSLTADNSPASRFLSQFNSQVVVEPDAEGQLIENYTIGKVIGYGAYSSIKEVSVTDSQTGILLIRAVKIVRKRRDSVVQRRSSVTDALTFNVRRRNINSDTILNDEVEIDPITKEFNHEVEIWKRLDHPNILKLIHVIDNDFATFCISRRIYSGTLFDIVKLNWKRGISEDLVENYASQIANGLQYLHNHALVVHRDIKLENCLLNESETGETIILICDFGMSEYYEKKPSNSYHEDEDRKEKYHKSLSSTRLSRMRENTGRPRRRSISPNLTGANRDKSRTSLYEDSKSITYNDSKAYGPSNASTVLRGLDSQERLDSFARKIEEDSPMKEKESKKGIDLRKDSITSAASSSTDSLLSSNSNQAKNESTTSFTSSTMSSSFIDMPNIGSLPYAAPEQLLNDDPIVDPSIDMWAFGVILYTMYVGVLPFHHSFEPKLRQMITQANWDRKALRNKIGSSKTGIVAKLLEKDISKRWTIDDLLSSTLFDKLKNKKDSKTLS